MNTYLDTSANQPEPPSPTQAHVAQLSVGLRQGALNPATLAGGLIVLVLILSALLAPLLATHDPIAQDLSTRLTPPGAADWLGTDQLGRDLYSRLLYGAQPTLMIVVLVVALSAPFGVTVGLLAGYLGGWVDVVLMSITNIVLAFPRLIVALAFVMVQQPGFTNTVIAIAITAWPPYACLAHAETLAQRRSTFVEVARSFGIPSSRIITRQILPLCLASAVIRAPLDMAGFILTAAALGFLGLGPQPPMAEWGAMIGAGRDHIFDAWWVGAVPGLAIVLVSLGFNLFGDGLRDALNPKHHD
jgi:peptide/nickel transport system permease protein